MRRRLVAEVPADALKHLTEVVLMHLALVELDVGPEAVGQWPAVRDRVFEHLEAQAALGGERAVRTWAALLQVGFDFEFAVMVADLDDGSEDGG